VSGHVQDFESLSISPQYQLNRRLGCIPDLMYLDKNLSELKKVLKKVERKMDKKVSLRTEFSVFSTVLKVFE